MDIDDDGTQLPAETNDFGIKPDFDQLEDEDKEVGRHGARTPQYNRLTLSER